MTEGTGTALQSIEALSAATSHYRAIFCDVWGVLHDGERKSAAAEAALVSARRAGLKVLLLTNSPRPAEAVARQLDMLAVTRDAYDGIVTSGDVTRRLIVAAGARLFHIGPSRDEDLFEALPVSRVGEAEASAVIVSGLFDDETETPADYAELLARLRARDLAMVCANPDVVVHRGERLIFCAGALARDYAGLGGEVRMAGKPFRPIYEMATQAVGDIERSAVLAIGDGLNTDIRGANDFGIDVLLIVDGIHGAELVPSGADAAALAATLGARDLQARYFMTELR